MKSVILCVCLIIFGSYARDEWTSLLDRDLTQWEMYLSYPLKNGYQGELPKDIQPIGYNNNVNKVFTVSEEAGEPVLRISGEIYGCVFTKQEYENYHLKLQVKWGAKKWEPRLNDPMDSGILYHSQGKCGVDYWRSWMLSQEFQIMEHSLGDYWSIASSQIDVKATPAPVTGSYKFDSNAQPVSLGAGTGNQGYCQGGNDYEKPMGEWNTVELICFEGKSIHIVNGHVVMALSNSRYLEGNISKPLTKGKIQLQSEAAEVYYKAIQIKKLEALPAAYAYLFN